MTVGLPGTGIGGLFYFCLVVLMPFREAWLTVRGRSSVARWRHIAFQWSLLLGILSVLWIEGWLITTTLNYLSTTDTWLAHRLQGSAQSTVGLVTLKTGQVAALASIVTLAAIVIMMGLLAALNRAGWLKAPPGTAMVRRVLRPLVRPA